MTHAQIASEIGLSESGVRQAVIRYGLSRPRISHKWALPWTVRKVHATSKVRKYLKDLSCVAQHKEIQKDHAATAISWANRLVQDGLDIAYHPDQPPNSESREGGFYTRSADLGNWHLKMVLERALSSQIREH